MLTFHHDRADLHFSWDGWMQIKIRAGANAPAEAFPDRFDIREPDLRDSSRHAMYPADGSVHFVPETQDAFEALCDTWWRGGEICVGVRDYAEDPWQARSWGITVGAFQYRYAGGSHIEASPGESQTWHPLIDLATEGRTPSTLSTAWLMGRVEGWEIAWLAAHGIVDQGRGIDDAIAQWSIATLPAPGARGSIMGQFDSWIYDQAKQEFASDDWQQRRDRGTYLQRITAERPWLTTRDSLDGTRWNFWWCGNPYAYVYSPDRRLSYDEARIAMRADHVLVPNPTQRLQHQADAWLLDNSHR